MQRSVFYLAGYDPRTARHYYSIFKKNLNIYNNLHKTQYKLSKNSHNSWQILAQDCQTTYNVLLWNDIVRQNWHEGFIGIMKDMCLFARFYFLNLLFIQFFKLNKGAFIAGLYPFLYIAFSYFLVFFLAYLFFIFISNIYLALVLSLIFIYFGNKLIIKIGKATASLWILRICVFAALLSKDKIENIEQRCDEFAQRIIKQLRQNQDFELILCAHSVGTMLLIPVLYKILQAKDELNLDKLKILSLGECIPLLSLHKDAQSFREQLEFIASKSLFWLDFTSKIDGACFYKLNFLKLANVKKINLKIHFLSAAFYKLYEKEEYRKIRKNLYRVHFLYLEAVRKKDGIYDFFNFIVDKKKLEEKI